jgi:hypothetical protein
MGLLSILGRLDLNGAGFTKTLNAAEKRADKFANGVTKKLAGVAGGAFGINALKQMGMEAIENGAEIKRLADQFSLTTDQVQLLQEEAKKTGQPFSSLVKDAGELEKTLKRIDGGNVLFDQKTVEGLSAAKSVIQEFKDVAGQRVAGVIAWGMGLREGVQLTPEQRAFQEDELERKRAAQAAEQGAKKRAEEELKIHKINEDAAELEKKTRDAGLTKAERILELEKQRARILRDIEIAPFDDGTEGAAMDRLRLAKVNSEIAGLKTGGETVKAQTKQMSPLSDSLSSVGNMLGMNPNSPQVRELNKANRLLEEIRNNTKSSLGGTSFPN